MLEGSGKRPEVAETRERFDFRKLSPDLQAEIEGDPAAMMTLRSRELDLQKTEAAAGSATQVGAFFDIDGTLIRGSIGGHMVNQAVSEGLTGRFTYVVFFIFFLLYKLNLIPLQRMYRWGYGQMKGIDLSDSVAFVRRCIDGRIRHRVVLGARAFVDLHRELGHRVVAVTGAPDYAAAYVAHALGFDDVLATPTPIDGERLGGEVETMPCYGPGKVSYVRAYAAQHSIDLSRSFFYSDSRSDLPLLKLVGRPLCVNPQLLLRLAAWRRGWDVLLLRRVGEI